MDNDPSLPELNADDFAVGQLFQKYQFEKTCLAVERKQRFVHYTTADTALKIIQNGQIWMRRTSCMNDFMELEHGFRCLDRAFGHHRKNFESVFDSIFPGFTVRLLELFNGWMPMFKLGTFLSCMSEHDPTEDLTGRLSMWRAYGGNAGVAFVMKGGPMFRHSDALAAYTYPVSYQRSEHYDQQFEALLNEVAAAREAVAALGEARIQTAMFHNFRATVLCTKHPGFFEEREWRIIYTPAYMQFRRIIADIQCIGGTPQVIQKIPLENAPEENLTGVDIPNLLDRIIIGPTQHPYVIAEAFEAALKAAGVPEADKRIFVSDIPLRN